MCTPANINLHWSVCINELTGLFFLYESFETRLCTSKCLELCSVAVETSPGQPDGDLRLVLIVSFYLVTPCSLLWPLKLKASRIQLSHGAVPKWSFLVHSQLAWAIVVSAPCGSCDPAQIPSGSLWEDMSDDGFKHLASKIRNWWQAH